MVNSGLITADLRDPEVRLMIAYAHGASRPALTALWALDAKLAQVLRTTREPMVGQMRLTWWHDAAGRAGDIAGEPVLAAAAAAGLPAATMRRIVEGWEALLDGDDASALTAYADGRGGGLFAAAAAALGASVPVEDAGAGWALVDLARHHSQPEARLRALALGKARLVSAPVRWDRASRPLGILTKLARRDLGGPEPQGSPRRVAATVALALTGR